MPPPALILLARHGETEWNRAGRWQGHTDVPLNDAGRAQARALATRVANAGIRAVACSDLARARETAAIVAEALGVEVERVDPDLRERGFGAFEGLTREEVSARFAAEWAAYAADPRKPPPGGEPQGNVIARMHGAVVRVARDLPSPVLVVSHGGAMRALVGHTLGEPVLPVPNVAVYRLLVDGERIVEAALVARDEPFAQ